MMDRLQGCRLCPRLTAFRNEQKIRFPEYRCLPVAGFGAAEARLLIVGLAPGLHGANATGRPFTGDASGQNMVTIATQAICNYIQTQAPIQPQYTFLEANLSGDKKASARSFSGVRGKNCLLYTSPSPRDS